MTLDPEFSKQTTDFIQQTLELYKSAGASKSWRNMGM